jgi:hypothetical protein
MTMAKSLDWRTVLAPEVVGQIEQEMDRKFAEGWYAYERALQEGMRAITPPPEVRGPRSVDQGGSSRGHAGPRAPRGYWDSLIVQVLKSVEPDRLGYTDLMARVQGKTQEYKLARSSFNVSLERLDGEGKIAKDGNSWSWRARPFRASSSDAGSDTGDERLSAPAWDSAN